MPNQIKQRNEERRIITRVTSFTAIEQTRENSLETDLVIEGYFSVFDDVYELWP